MRKPSEKRPYGLLVLMCFLLSTVPVRAQGVGQVVAQEGTAEVLRVGTSNWILLFILASLFTALPHSLFTHSLKYLKAKSVSLIASLQPLYGAFFAFLILNEQPSIATAAGGLIILGAASYESYTA